MERSSTPTKTKSTPGRGAEPKSDDSLSTLRADLATTQKARGVLQARVEELSTSLAALQKQEKRSLAQIALLTKQKAEVEWKLRDRDDELRGKNKMVERAQDEMVALGLQLNMAEKRSEKLEVDNKELVNRWMKLRGEQADQMNRESKWE